VESGDVGLGDGGVQDRGEGRRPGDRDGVAHVKMEKFEHVLRVRMDGEAQAGVGVHDADPVEEAEVVKVEGNEDVESGVTAPDRREVVGVITNQRMVILVEKLNIGVDVGDMISAVVMDGKRGREQDFFTKRINGPMDVGRLGEGNRDAAGGNRKEVAEGKGGDKNAHGEGCETEYHEASRLAPPVV